MAHRLFIFGAMPQKFLKGNIFSDPDCFPEKILESKIRRKNLRTKEEKFWNLKIHRK